MSSVGDKDIKQEATAFLASIMDADDQDLGKAATKVEWQRSPIPTSQIITCKHFQNAFWYQKHEFMAQALFEN